MARLDVRRLNVHCPQRGPHGRGPPRAARSSSAPAALTAHLCPGLPRQVLAVLEAESPRCGRRSVRRGCSLSWGHLPWQGPPYTRLCSSPSPRRLQSRPIPTHCTHIRPPKPPLRAVTVAGPGALGTGWDTVVPHRHTHPLGSLGLSHLQMSRALFLGEPGGAGSRPLGPHQDPDRELARHRHRGHH